MNKEKDKHEGFSYDLGLDDDQQRPGSGTSPACWVYMNCSPEVRETCPAHPDRGQECWKVTGGRCGQGRIEKPSREQKIEYCRQCDYYKNIARKY